MRIKRIFKSLVCCFLVLSTCSSCAKSFDKRMEIANEKVIKKPCVIEVELDFNCSDATVSGIFEQLERSESSVYFKDGRLKAVNELKIDDGTDVYSYYTSYTVAGGVLYADINYAINGDAASDPKKVCADISEEEAKRLAGDTCIIGDVSTSGFSVVTESKSGRKRVAVYSDPSDDNRRALEQIMTEQLEGSCDSVVLKWAELTIEIEKKKYNFVAITAKYDVTIKGTTYPVEMTVELDFDYDKRLNVYPPEDTSVYPKGDLKNIIG